MFQLVRLNFLSANESIWYQKNTKFTKTHFKFLNF